MKGPATRLIDLYAWLMRLYPAGYRHEFGAERQELFGWALEEACGRGNRALLRLVFRELRDFPGSAVQANLRELEAVMKTIEIEIGEEHISRTGLLLGVWPFLFAGPLMAVLPYLPGQIAEPFFFGSPLWWAVAGVSLLLGLVLGWRKNFPRWVYPYLVILFFVIAGPALGLLGVTGLNRFNPWISTAILLLSILALGAAALFLLSRIRRTRKIVDDVRSDWTRLSFGMILFLAFYTGLYTGDHLPPFGPVVWLPSMLVVLGALAYLLSRSQALRILVLIATLGSSVFFGTIIFQGDAAWAIWPATLLASLILSPVLLGLLPRPALPAPPKGPSEPQPG